VPTEPETERKAKENKITKNCGLRFIADHERTYKGTLLWVKNLVKIMPVRGVGVRDIGIILQISTSTVLKVLNADRDEGKRPGKPAHRPV
jgi:transposase-like protein